MNFELINEDKDNEISDFVYSCPKSLVYTNPHFTKLISNLLGTESSWIVSRNQKRIVGVMPFVQSKPSDYGIVINSMPYFGSNGGVIQKIADINIKRKLITMFFKYSKDMGACSATIITNPFLKDHLVYESTIEGFFRDERIGQITELPSSTTDDLLALFEKPRARNIRKAEKEGIIVSYGNEKSSLEFLHRIHVENMRVLGGLSKSWDFFEKLYEYLPKDFWSVYVGTKNNQPIAALLVLFFNGTAEYFTPVIISEYRNTQALPFIIYEAMKDALSNKGCKYWNWGGTWANQTGVYNFKKKWGALDYPYYYYTKLFREDLLFAKKEDLVECYDGFYVVPFNRLRK